MRVGTATAEPGQRASGWLEVTELPTGGAERLPVVLCNGTRDGPILWLTGSVHGDEHNGLAVAQDVPDDRLLSDLAGAVVSIPVCNPAGLRRTARESYYHGDDPNRYFPDPDAEQYRPPRVQEAIDRRLYDALTGADDAPTEDASADALLDLHTAQVGSMPFTIRDRAFYGDDWTESEAEGLSADLGALAGALGFPVVTEYPGEEYRGERLHRSLSGAVFAQAELPALTVELGGHSVVEDRQRDRGVAACLRGLVHLGGLEAVPDWAPEADPVPAPVEYPVRRARHPNVESAGIVRHRVAPGDVVATGDLVAEVVSPHGEVVERVETDHEGFVLARSEGVAAYENDPVASLAVRDDDPLVVPHNGGSGAEQA